MATITLIEPATEVKKRTDLEIASAMQIHQLREALRPLVDLRGSLDGDLVSISSGTMIGTMRVRDLRVDVKPRLSDTDLVSLIRYAYDGDYVHGRSEVTPDHHGIDELLCRVLVEELDLIRQRGVSRSYVNRRQALTALRGRPDFLASFPWNDGGMTTLTCRYHELTCDTLDNQLVLAALEPAMMLDVRPSTRGRLNAHRHAWHELAQLRTVGRPEFTRARSKYSRLTEHYRLAHHVCELIVERQRPRSLYEVAVVVTAGIAVDMAELFELAVYRLLRDGLVQSGWSVRFQSSDAHALHDGNGNPYRRIRPDILIYHDDVPIAVIDAKYKDYWEAHPSTAVPLQRISNEDLYQLFFYSSRLQAHHFLSEAPPAVIVLPIPEVQTRLGTTVIGDQYRNIHYVAGAETAQLSLMLLPLVSVIRELSENGFDASLCPAIKMFVAELGTICNG